MAKKADKKGKQPVEIAYLKAMLTEVQSTTKRLESLINRMEESGKTEVTVSGKEGSETFLTRVSGFISNIQRELDMPQSVFSLVAEKKKSYTKKPSKDSSPKD